MCVVYVSVCVSVCVREREKVHNSEKEEEHFVIPKRFKHTFQKISHLLCKVVGWGWGVENACCISTSNILKSIKYSDSHTSSRLSNF